MTFRVEHITLIIMTVLTIVICPTDSKILVTSKGTKETVDIFHDNWYLFGRSKINWADKSVKNYLIQADPPYACYDVKPPPTLQFETTGRDSAKIVSTQVRWILFTSDSDCGLIEKELFAKKAGYSAIIIYNERTNEPELMAHTHFLQLNDPIDVTFVGKNDGLILKRDYVYPKRYIITFEQNIETTVPRETDHPPRTQSKFPQKQTHTFYPGICSGLSFQECCSRIVEYYELTEKLIILICCLLLLLLARRGPPEPPIHNGDDDVIRGPEFNDPIIPPGLWLPLPELVSITTFKTDGDFYHKQCVICLEDFNDSEELYKLPCTHYFHKKCIRDWFQKSISYDCPLCRTGAAEENLDEQRRLLYAWRNYIEQRRRRH